ncbi:plasmid pRiA4b ORF-3 family protein [Cobetia sp. Dlab-2-AX]|nr:MULTISPECIES: plasmid pRiA4b ORF-3 family protein [unclassified Cobetia]MCO7233473.1 plasmid pRiA4b ORF-3 family protein [Cobetia sp. Dlab-2-AX]MCO7236749.1 plasmid pRiA4b ORF-3 family protein [Cobetia sp. Dlab-2-U]
MGWEEQHLYEFECDGRYYAEPDDFSERPITMSRNAKLKTLVKRAKGNAFQYLYDFGDDWEHRISIEATGMEAISPCPRWLDGAMACPRRISAVCRGMLP